jgi:glycopeptide antibiotics resistance protein
MVATVMLLSKNLTFSQQLTQALFIVAVFIPFSYFLDRVFYRSFLKRTAKSRTAGGKSGG